MPIYWAVALALLGVSLVIAGIACFRAAERETAVLAGLPGLALLTAFAVDVIGALS